MNDDLTARIADILHWSTQDVRSVPIASLREIVRPVSPKLTYELTVLISGPTLLLGTFYET
jgi:hypothetical protein